MVRYLDALVGLFELNLYLLHLLLRLLFLLHHHFHSHFRFLHHFLCLELVIPLMAMEQHRELSNVVIPVLVDQIYLELVEPILK